MHSVVKIFQCKDGSLFFFANIHPAIPKEGIARYTEAILAVKRDGDRVLMARNCDFQFFNISDSQLKEMEIKPEPPAEPK